MSDRELRALERIAHNDPGARQSLSRAQQRHGLTHNHSWIQWPGFRLDAALSCIGRCLPQRIVSMIDAKICSYCGERQLLITAIYQDRNFARRLAHTARSYAAGCKDQDFLWHELEAAARDICHAMGRDIFLERVVENQREELRRIEQSEYETRYLERQLQLNLEQLHTIMRNRDV